MLLSFIVPIYNSEKYLEECLDSLLKQDIPAKDFEVICINDGATDSVNSSKRGHMLRTNGALSPF